MAEIGDFRDAQRRVWQAVAHIDPLNRWRNAYLRGEITVDELEVKIAAELGLDTQPSAP